MHNRGYKAYGREHKNRVGWKLVLIMFVKPALWFSYHVVSNTSPIKCDFFPDHLNEQYTDTNMHLTCFSALK